MVRSTASTVALLSSVAFSSMAFAGTASFGGDDVKLGVEYRTEFKYSDNGLNKTKGSDPTKTTSISLDQANLTMGGKLGADVMFDVNYGAGGGLNWFYVDYNASSMFKFRAGKDRANVGGWENEHNLYDIFGRSAYTSKHRPFVDPVSSFELMVNVGGGTVGVQLLDDVKVDATNTLRFNNASKQPTGIIEYSGNFGMISPLVQVGTYDANHSMFYTVGLNLKVADLDAYLDFTGDNRARREAADSSKELVDAHTSLVADFRYTMSKVQYFLKYSMYDQKQKPTDLKVNSVNVEDFSDNGTVVAVGVRCNQVDAFNPYFAYEMHSGKYADADGKEETRSSNSLLLGVLGKI